MSLNRYRYSVVESDTYDQLLRLNGHYPALWQRQSGGFLHAGDAARAAE